MLKCEPRALASDADARRYIPFAIVFLMAGVNMLGVDWLLRFEVVLGAITLVLALARSFTRDHPAITLVLVVARP